MKFEKKQSFLIWVGKASKASVLVLLRQIILFIPLTFILPGLGINDVFLAPALTDAVVTIMAAIILISEFRRPDIPS